MSRTDDHKARLKALAAGQRAEPSASAAIEEAHISERRIPEIHTSEVRLSEAYAVEVNPEHGQRGGFRKATVTMRPSTFEAVHGEVHRRKMAGEPNALLSAVLREAVAFWQAAGMPPQE